MAGFECETLIEECKRAITGELSQKAVREVVARAVSEPGAVLGGLGEPTRAGVERLYQSYELTVLNVIWGPMMTLMPHNHEMWAVIGVYTGRENNIFWRRLQDGRIEAAGACSLGVTDAIPMGRDIIHSVTNPLARLTGAIHVYGGDFFNRPRSEWGPDSLTEQAYDVEKNMKLFEASNRLLELV